MILAPISWAIFIAVCVFGWIVVQIGKYLHWIALGIFLFLCTQVSLADEPRRYVLVKMTLTEFVELSRHSTHFDCMDAMHSQIMMTKRNELIVGFLCEPPMPEPLTHVIPKCLAPVRECA